MKLGAKAPGVHYYYSEACTHSPLLDFRTFGQGKTIKHLVVLVGNAFPVFSVSSQARTEQWQGASRKRLQDKY